MFNWLEKKKGDGQSNIRDTLFGDMPLAEWARQNQPDPGEPWSWFIKARRYLEAGDKHLAIEELKKVIEMPGLEARHYLQAWHFLRQLGVTPPDDKAKDVYGVVVEYTLTQGGDIVAAYTDHTARYFNYSGIAIIWETSTDSLINTLIDDLLQAGQSIIHHLGSWKDVRPSAPSRGNARVNMLTPSGLHFGQASLDVLAKDAIAGPIIAAATRLMQALIARNVSKFQPPK